MRFIAVFLIVYAITIIAMTITIIVNKRWDENKTLALLCVFAPIFNTFVLCVGVFYVIPSDAIKEYKERIKQKHRFDPRWNLMNIRIKED